MLPLPAASACNNVAAPLCAAKRCWPKRGESPRAPLRRRRREQQQQEEVQGEPGRLALLASPVVAAVLALSPAYLAGTPVSVAQPIEVSQKGAALFQRACIGCHDAGGNILQPGATLFTRDLQRNGITTEEELYNITYFGKGRMPGFGEKCTPRGQCTFGARLQEDEIKALAEFVKSQADKGWPRLEVYGD